MTLAGREPAFLNRSDIRENAMNRSLFVPAFAALTLLWSAAAASAQQSGTAAEAKAMLENAVVALKGGEPAALAEFNDKGNKKFHDRDLYVFCYDMTNGKFTAHPNPALMGSDVRALKVKDDPLGQRIFDTVKGASGGTVATVDYNFPKPGTTDAVPKQSFVTMVGNEGCGVGYYK
jgi:cytochrome c